jgi:threonine dehydrogenase-like Zn-dependent dehydrogenase
MRAVRNTVGGVAVVDIDEPSGDGVLLDIAVASICGTDTGLVAMGVEPGAEYTLGHEFAGTAGGVAYAVEPSIWCGSCDQCLAGFTQRCVGARGTLGVWSDGGLSDVALVPEQCLVALPPGLDVGAACLVEPMAVSWRGVRRAAIQPGERVVVVGGGSIGLLAVAAARAAGHEVALDARYPHQIAAGERLGATTPRGVYDVVIEAAGSDSGVARCAELAAHDGRVMLLGVFHGSVAVPGIPTLMKELTWTAAMAYGRESGVREVDEAAALLASDPEIASTLITHTFPLEDAAEAFRVAGDRAAGVIKVRLEV